MLEQITWGQYLTLITLVTGGYYAVVGMRYYKREINDILHGNRQDNLSGDDASPGNEKVPSDSTEPFAELEDLVNGIRFGILEKAGEAATKDTLLAAISERVANFSGLGKPAYRYALNNFIIQHGRAICGVAFSEEELDAVWEALPR